MNESAFLEQGTLPGGGLRGSDAPPPELLAAMQPGIRAALQQYYAAGGEGV